MNDTKGRGEPKVSITIVAPETAPQWVKDRADLYTRILQELRQHRQQLERMPDDAARH